ncbi:MAG: DNA polymerase III subunit beta [Candidatus Dormibacteraceae bacterium]
MKVTCRPSVFGQALQVVSRAISSRTTLPILNNILIETTSEGLALTATNLEIGIRKLVTAEVSMEGATTAPARLLTDFVGTLPDQDLEMTLDGASQSLSLRCARFDTHIKCIEAEEFPPGPRPDEGDRLEVALDDLISAVEQTQMAASTDEARPVLTGVLLMIQGGSMTLAATDGHRLAVRKLPAAGAGELDASLIVPARALAELSRVLKGEPGKVEVIISKARNQVFFRSGTSELTSRLIDGKYPNYAQVIPSKSSTKVRVSTSELTQTVRAVSLFARDSANVIRVKAQAGALILSATTNEVGDSKAEMAADVDGSEIQIAFNARYLLDALGVIGEDEVELLFDGPLSPGLLRPPGKEHYLYVIMPVRVAMS